MIVSKNELQTLLKEVCSHSDPQYLILRVFSTKKKLGIESDSFRGTIAGKGKKFPPTLFYAKSLIDSLVCCEEEEVEVTPTSVGNVQVEAIALPERPQAGEALLSLSLTKTEWSKVIAALQIGDGILSVSPDRTFIETANALDEVRLSCQVKLAATGQEMCLFFPQSLALGFGEESVEIVLTKTTIAIKGKYLTNFAPKQNASVAPIDLEVMQEENVFQKAEIKANDFCDRLKGFKPVHQIHLQIEKRMMRLIPDTEQPLELQLKRPVSTYNWNIAIDPKLLLGVYQVASSIAGAALVFFFPKTAMTLLLIRLGSGMVMGVSAIMDANKQMEEEEEEKLVKVKRRPASLETEEGLKKRVLSPSFDRESEGHLHFELSFGRMTPEEVSQRIAELKGISGVEEVYVKRRIFPSNVVAIDKKKVS